MKQLSTLIFAVLLAILAQSCDDKTIRVVCIGDSITEGDGLADRQNEAYPAFLSKELGEGYKVINLGQSGATLLRNGDWPYWKKIAFRNALAIEPDIAVILLGANDSKPQNIPSYPGEYIKDLRTMVDSLQSLPSHPEIYLCKPMPAFENRFNINDSVLVAEVLPAIDRVAIEKACNVIDLHTAFAGRKDIIPDGVHPNKEGAKEMATFIATSLRK